MKHFKIFAVLAAVASALMVNHAQAAGLEQPLLVNVIGNYQTNFTNFGVNPVQMQVQLTGASVIRSIVIESSFTNHLTNFANPAFIRTNFFQSGRLFRRIDADSGAESIIIRWQTNVADVTSFFFPNVTNNFSASNEVVSSSVNPTTGQTNAFSTLGLHTFSMTTSNVTINITGFGSVTGMNVGKVGTNSVNKLVEMLTGFGAGTFSLNVGTNFASSTNVVSGTCHGTFVTGAPVFRQTP